MRGPRAHSFALCCLIVLSALHVVHSSVARYPDGHPTWYPEVGKVNRQQFDQCMHKV